MSVYLVNSVNDDTTPALQFGDIKHIGYRYVYGDEINDERMPMVVEEQIKKFADEFDPERDYLLIAGDHLQLVAFAAALGAKYGKFRVLRWDRRAVGYLPVQILV